MLATLFVVALAAAEPQTVEAAPQLTLAQAVERARTGSPGRAAAAALAQGATTAARLAGRLLNPLIDVRAENLTPRDQLAPNLDLFALVTQPVEFGGKRQARRELADVDRDVSGLLLRTVERQLALDTVRIYMRAVRSRDVLQTLTAQREGVGTLVATMRRRVEEGLSPESDLLRFEAEAARMAAEQTRTDLELTRSLLELGALIGASTPITPGELVSPEPVPPPRPTSEVLSASLDRRPDMQLASARLERARLAADLERLRRLPDPSFTAGYKRTQGQNTAVAAVVMAVPLFDRNAQARATAEAGLRAARFERDAVQVRALTEVQATISAATALADTASRVHRDLLRPAEGVRHAAEAMFREGAADVLKLVDAERIYADVRREALSLAVDAYVAAIEARFSLAQEDIP